MTTVPLIRVFRAERTESADQARQRRAELITFDGDDLVRIVARCQTPFRGAEARLLRDAARSIPRGATADIFMRRGGRVDVALREPVGAS
jgi:hypothetical protein